MNLFPTGRGLESDPWPWHSDTLNKPGGVAWSGPITVFEIFKFHCDLRVFAFFSSFRFIITTPYYSSSGRCWFFLFCLLLNTGIRWDIWPSPSSCLILILILILIFSPGLKLSLLRCAAAAIPGFIFSYVALLLFPFSFFLFLWLSFSSCFQSFPFFYFGSDLPYSSLFMALWIGNPQLRCPISLYIFFL